MGAIWGLVAACSWGTGDYIAKGVSGAVGAYRTVLYAHIVSLMLLTGVIVWLGSSETLSVSALLLGAGLGILNTVGSLLLYRSLTIGQVAVVSPIGSSFAAITLVLSLLSGDRISSAKLAALVVTICGVVLAASAPATGEVRTRKIGLGVGEAMAAACAFGVNFWGLKYIVPALGPWLPVLEGRGASLILLPLLAVPLKQSIRLPVRRVWGALLVMAVLDTTANIAYNQGLRSTTPGIVAVLGSLFSPITVLLALALLKERLAVRQWIGVGMIIGSVGALNWAQQ
ncbi:MAG: DMT family transporter [Herpetosiphon sp.]